MRKLHFFQVALCLLFFEGGVYAQQPDEEFKPQVTDNPRIQASAVQADGKVILGGDIVSASGIPVKKLIRLNPDGSLDNSFNPPLVGQDYYILSILVESGGKIVIGGKLSPTEYAMRLNPDGSKDQTFSLPSTVKDIMEMISMPDGKYLILNSSPKPLVKVNADGTLDTSFDAGTGPDSYGSSNSTMAVQADGKIIFVGTFSNFNGAAVNHIIRLNLNGTTDDSFSIGTGPQGVSSVTLSSVLIQGDGKVLLAGSFESFNGIACKNLVMLTANGSVDPNFILPGPAANYFDSRIGKIAFQGDAILLGSFRLINEVFEYGLMKLNADGSLFPGFTTIPMNYSINVGYLDDPTIVVSGNKILYTGYFDKVGSVLRPGIAILDELGALNTEFNPQVGGPAYLEDIVKQADGKILLAGRFDHVGSVKVKNITRLNPDGTVDEAFQNNLGTGPNLAVYCMAIQSDGKILVGGGFSSFNGNNQTALLRLNSDGSLDNGFTAGLALNFVGPGVNAIKVQSSGKMVVGGTFSRLDDSSIKNLVRLNTNGTPDNTFNNLGLSEGQYVHAIAQQSDNNLLIGGTSWTTGGFLRKTSEDGVVQNDFSTTDLSGTYFFTIGVLPNNNFLAAGDVSTGSSTTPNPIYQFDKDGNLLDKISLAVYEGSVQDIEALNTEDILISGQFKKVNTIPSQAFAKVKLNGVVDSFSSFTFGYPYDWVSSMVRADPAKNIFYAVGNFQSINGINFFSTVKLNLDSPAAPTDLVLVTDDINGTVQLTWTDKSSLETGFSIHRGEGGVFVAIDSVAANITTFTDLTALPVKTYAYKVRALSAEYTSSYSNTVEVSTATWVPPSAPQNLAFDISDDFTSVTLSWTDASSTEAGFELERSVGASAFSLRQEIPANQASVIEDFTFDEAYTFRMRALNKFGYSDYSPELVLPVILDAETDAIAGLRVYPNPIEDHVRIEQAFEKQMTVTVHDLRGTITRSYTGSEKSLQMDARDLLPGVYLLKIFAKEKTSVYKLVKH